MFSIIWPCPFQKHEDFSSVSPGVVIKACPFVKPFTLTPSVKGQKYRLLTSLMTILVGNG